MNTNEQRCFLPSMLALWLFVAFFNVFAKFKPELALSASYLLAFGQIVFDFIAFGFFVRVMRNSTRERRFPAVCFGLALLFLFLSDFFYYASGFAWFSLSPMVQHFTTDLPLTGFFAFMLVGFVRVTLRGQSKKENGSFQLLAVLSAFFVLASFFFGAPDAVNEDTVASWYYSIQTVLQALGAVFALLAMAREFSASINVLVVGFLALFMADFFLNINANVLLTTQGDDVFEILWMLGSVLMAVAGYMRIQES